MNNKNSVHTCRTAHTGRTVHTSRMCLSNWALFPMFAWVMSFAIVSCSAPSVVVTEVVEEPVLIVPSGVDSTIAVKSQELAEESFVPEEVEEQVDQMKEEVDQLGTRADSLWYFLTLGREDLKVSENDSIAAIKSFNAGAQFFIEMRRMENENDLTVDETRLQHNALIDSSISMLENAIMLNPFDAETKALLAQQYYRKGVRLNNENDFRNAIETWENLIRIERGEHSIFAALGDNYFEVGEYDSSGVNFRRAYDVLMQTGMFSDHYYEFEEYHPDDRATLFSYLYFAAEAFTFVFQSDQAVESFRQSLEYTESESDIEAVESYLEFIGWDGGDIANAFERDRILELTDLTEIETGLLALLELIGTQKAYDEIDWRLSLTQYSLDKPEEAVERLKNLVARSEKDSLGMAATETYTEYFEDYATMCYNIAQKHLSERDRRTALTYLLQSVEIPWSKRARSYLGIAVILQNNIDQAMFYAREAESQFDQLTPDEQKNLYRLFNNLHRRMGNMDLASRYYQLFRSM